MLKSAKSIRALLKQTDSARVHDARMGRDTRRAEGIIRDLQQQLTQAERDEVLQKMLERDTIS